MTSCVPDGLWHLELSGYMEIGRYNISIHGDKGKWVDWEMDMALSTWSFLGRMRSVAMMGARRGWMQCELPLQLYVWCAATIWKTLTAIEDDLNFSTMILEFPSWWKHSMEHILRTVTVSIAYILRWETKKQRTNTYIMVNRLVCLLVHLGDKTWEMVIR